MTNHKRRVYIKKLIKQKEQGKVHLELDLDFIKDEHKDILSLNEDQLRQNLEKAHKSDNKKEVMKIEDQLGVYKNIRKIYDRTKNELGLMTKYIKYLRECL